MLYFPDGRVITPGRKDQRPAEKRQKVIDPQGLRHHVIGRMPEVIEERGPEGHVIRSAVPYEDDERKWIQNPQ